MEKSVKAPPVAGGRGSARARSSDSDAVGRVSAAVGEAVRGVPRLVLAVSGGRDSMVMLDALARDWRGSVACVATFDHGTGEAASAAAALVERRSRELGVPVRSARLEGPQRAPRREASWREARWRFLRGVARSLDARVVTAHTLDDQVETVFMRALRGSGARGLAALYASSDVVRPLLHVSRADVAASARAHGVEWIDDPSNQSRRYLRNRVRLDLLPALEEAHPGLSDDLLALSRRAAELRSDVELFVDRNVRFQLREGVLMVARADLRGYDASELGVLWPALAARLGLVLDRRGTERIAEFTIKGRAGGRVQLSGAYEAVLHRGMLLLRRTRASAAARDERPLDAVLSLDGWRFKLLEVDESGLDTPRLGDDRLWRAALPADKRLRVRAWRPGDRMTPYGAAAPRRVKGLLRDAGVDAGRRDGWPVVLADDEIVWIPGVRRSAAATVRSGRPVVVYECDRDDD